MNPDTKTPQYLAYIIFGIVALTEAGLFFVEIPAGNKEILNTTIQSVQLIAVAAASFFWGSSVGSRAKDNKPPQR
jgi:hypothetical protein